MTRTLLCLLLAPTLAVAADTVSKPGDPAGYRTAETAIRAQVKDAGPARPGQSGFLGVRTARDAQGRLVIEELPPDSPAAKAGLKAGDVLLRLDGQKVGRSDVLREWLQARPPGATVRLEVSRGGKSLDVTATLSATSRPMRLDTRQRVFFGAQLAEAPGNEGARVERLLNSSPAAEAGLKTGDVILKLNGEPLGGPGRFTDALAERRPGDTLMLAVRREGKDVELKVRLTADRGQGGQGGRTGFRPDPSPPTSLWKKDTFRLAVICVEYPDVKHNAKVALKDWEEALFSRTIYVGKNNATGQAVHGSLNDYFQEQSCGTFRVTGKAFDWVTLAKKRGEYQQGSGTANKSVPLTEALDKVLARDGKDALKDFDGLFFVYAGERAGANRGALYSPHAGGLIHQQRRWPYLLAPEGGSRMSPLSVYVREFAFLLGLPDLAARRENAGSEGAGVWCALSSPLGTGRPQHLCAWAKEQLGWLQPVVVDPTVKQKLVLGPVEDSRRECVKVLVRLDGSEYFLLENRRRKGFDADLPGEGLLIWRVVDGRPVLEESHGVEGAAGPRVFVNAVPYPSASNNAFTPDTTPSSRSPSGGGLPVHLTEIRRLPDGRVAFQIGYDFQ